MHLIENKKIFIGGFSQSGCLALYSGLTYDKNIAGIIALNAFNFDFAPLDSKTKGNVPILTINGLKDETVLIKQARKSYLNLKKLKFNLKTVEEAGLYHSFSKDGLKQANEFLLNNNFDKINV